MLHIRCENYPIRVIYVQQFENYTRDVIRDLYIIYKRTLKFRTSVVLTIMQQNNIILYDFHNELY